MLFFAAFITALVVTTALIPPLIQMSGSLRLVDQPDHRKVHSGSIPRIGGIGMVLALLLSMLLWIPLEKPVVSMAVAIGILFVFGVWDDRGDLDFRLKFLGQFLASLVVVVHGGVIISVFPFFGMDPVTPWVSIPFTLIVLVAVTNAINLSDGLDGLAGGITLLSFAGIAILAYLSGGTILLMLTVTIMGVIAGFIRFNTYPARIFMGDTGSQLLGFTAGVLSVILTQDVNPALNPAIPLLLLGIPLFDTMFVMLKRIYHGVSPFSPDRNHIHHQLLAIGFDHYEAVVIIYAFQALFVLSGVSFRYQSDLFVVLFWLSSYGILALTLVWAGRARWRGHIPGARVFFTRWLSADTSSYMVMASRYILSIGVILLLLFGPVLASSVPPDIGVAAMIFFALLLLRLVFGYRMWFLSLRLMMYVTVAFLVYLLEHNPPGWVADPVIWDYLLYGIVGLGLVVSARSNFENAFRATPTDFLVILLIVGVTLMPQFSAGESDIAHLAVKIVILFYAIEFLLPKMTSRWSPITLCSLWSLGCMGIRGVL